jgi:hypothetical protein
VAILCLLQKCVLAVEFMVSKWQLFLSCYQVSQFRWFKYFESGFGFGGFYVTLFQGSPEKRVRRACAGRCCGVAAVFVEGTG